MNQVNPVNPVNKVNQANAAWIDEAMIRMQRIVTTSELVQTTYMMERVWNNLLDIYRELGEFPDPTAIDRIDQKRLDVRHRVENLELHVQLMLGRVVQPLQDPEQRPSERRAASERRQEERRDGERRQVSAGNRRAQARRGHAA